MPAVPFDNRERVVSRSPVYQDMFKLDVRLAGNRYKRIT